MTLEKYWSLAVAVMVSGVLVSCDPPSDSNGNGETQEGDVVPYTEGIRIAWDYRTLTEVYGGPSSYARVHRLDDGRIICTFESRGASVISISDDEGKTWSDPQTVAEAENGVIAAVPELLQLESGELLLAYNTRPPNDNQDTSRRFGIKLMISRDNGATWEHQSDVYEAGYRPRNGVWEPNMIELDNGELQLYVANEFPYQNSNDQEITMFRSFDKGETWENTVTVSYRPGHRDGMPVPLILDSNKGMAVAIEDNGISGNFKPVIIWSSMEDNWSRGSAGPESPRRWRALAGGHRLSPGDYGGGPYLAQLDDGSTILSFQSNKGRQGPWNESTMMVAIGNDEARSFTRISRPFSVPEGRRALWNSVFVKDQQTVTAVSTTTAFNPNYQQVYAIDGHVINELTAVKAEIELDGRLDENVWENAPTSFVGARSRTVSRMSAAWDDDFLYVGFDISDSDLWSDSEDWDSDDGVQLYWAAGKLLQDGLVEGTRMTAIPVRGEPSVFKGSASGNLVAVEEDTGVEAEIIRNGTLNESGSRGEGYTIELQIPWDFFGGKPSIGKPWGIHFTLSDDDGGGQAEIREGIAGNSTKDPTTWCKITLVEN